MEQYLIVFSVRIV